MPKEQALTRERFHKEMALRDYGASRLRWVSFFLAIILVNVGMWPLKDLRNTYDAQVTAVDMFTVEGSTIDRANQRRELAKSILVIRKHDDSIAAFNDPEVEKRLPTVAKTGEPLGLHPAKPSILDLLKFVASWWVIGTLILMSWRYGLRVLRVCYKLGLWAFELPWDRRWAWGVLLRAPWLVLAMATHYITLRRQLKAQALKVQQQPAAVKKR